MYILQNRYNVKQTDLFIDKKQKQKIHNGALYFTNERNEWRNNKTTAKGNREKTEFLCAWDVLLGNEAETIWLEIHANGTNERPLVT